MTTIQEGAFANAFDWAVVRLATYFPPTASQARLLFGSISLLTKDRPRPRSMAQPDCHKIRNGRSGTVFFKRTVLTAQDALEWYRSAGPDCISTPIPSEREVVAREDGIPLSPTSFEDDPQWPSLGVPLSTDLFSSAGGPGDPAPFLGAGSPRLHRRFGDDSGFDAVLSDASAIDFLSRRLHLDLSDYTEYLGGLALIVPDPVIHHVQQLLIPPQNSDGPERLVLRLVPRAGQNLSDLKLTVLERRSNLLSRFEPVDVQPNGLVTVESRLPFDQTGYAISHPEQGVLAYQQPVAFIRAVSVSLGVTGRRVRVQAPRTESPRSPVDNYEVTEIAHDIPINVGEERRGVGVRIIEAEQRRVKRAEAKRHKQTWFDDGQRGQAISFLREQISRARTSVMVVDPYFSALQIPQFLHAVLRTEIDFTILTSRLAFESGDNGDIEVAQDNGQDHTENTASISKVSGRLASFKRSLETLSQRGIRRVTVLVLNARRPPLHDRFLVIDDEVLFLGNSLNALGTRASLILSVPDNEPILEKLLAMASLAQPFESYASQRSYSSDSPSQGT